MCILLLLQKIKLHIHFDTGLIKEFWTHPELCHHPESISDFGLASIDCQLPEVRVNIDTIYFFQHLSICIL